MERPSGVGVKGELITSQEDRREAVIATLTGGHVMHATGSRREALRDIARVCDARGVKVRCLSTPQTIYRDLNGHRRKSPAGGTVTGADWEAPASLERPEPHYLALIGRKDLSEWRGDAQRN